MVGLRLPGTIAIFMAIGIGWVNSAAAVPFTSSFTSGGTWNTVYAQGFSPSESVSPDPGVGILDPVSLDRFQFFKSGNADAASNIRLAIVDNIFMNLDSLTTSSAELIGLSTNTVANTAGIATGSPITFNFDSLQLTYGVNYAAIFVNAAGTDLNPVLVSALTANYTENPTGSGMYLPTTNYGDPDPDFPGVFALATSGWTHTDSFGTFFDMYGGAGDAVFSAFFNQEPEGPDGDFNLDGKVDAADYVMWRKNGGSQDDYNLWKDNFGTSGGEGASAGLTGGTGVPEPSAAVLLCLPGAVLWLRGRRAARRG